MKRHIIKMAAAVLGSVLLAGCGDLPAYANSGEDPNPDEIITSFEELELIRPTDDDDEEEETPPVAEARIVDDINGTDDDEYEDNSLTALTPEGNMTLVDDITTKGGKQFLTMTSRSGSYFYIVIDRAKTGENNVYFLNQVDERDLLSSMNEEDRTFLEEEAKKKAEEEAAIEAAEKVKQEEEAAAAAAAESAAAQAESEAAAARETRTHAGIRIGNLTITPQMEAILACAGILVVVLIIILVAFKKKKPADQAYDPDDYDDYDDELDDEPEQEDDGFGEDEE